MMDRDIQLSMRFIARDIGLCLRIGVYCTLTGVGLLSLAIIAMLWAGLSWLASGSWTPIRVDALLRETLGINPGIYSRIGWVGLRMIIEWFVSLPLYGALLVLVPVLFASGWTFDKVGGALDRRAK